MRKKIILGLGMTLAFSVGVNAQEYKINKVGSDEQKSFDVLLNQKTVSEASAGSWLYVNPIVPNGKVFKGFTVYDQYGTSQSERKVSNTETKDLQFLMPDHDVYVTASYESLRYYLTVKNTDNGSVSLSFSDRYRDRTKPGVKVTVNPNAADGFKVASVIVSKYLDAKTTVTCTNVDTARAGMPGVDENAVDGRCTFEMPNFDVEVSAVFTAESAPEQKNGNNRFNVFYELNGGALPDAFTQSFSCDSTAKLPVPTKNGFDFIGWSLENKLDNVYYALDRLDGSSCVDKRVYAIWTEKGVCPEQKAIAVDGKLPQCTSSLNCALFHSNSANQDSVCNGVMWVAYVASVSSSSAVTLSSSSEDEEAVELFSSSDVAVASSSSKDEEAVELYSSSVSLLAQVRYRLLRAAKRLSLAVLSLLVPALNLLPALLKRLLRRAPSLLQAALLNRLALVRSRRLLAVKKPRPAQVQSPFRLAVKKLRLALAQSLHRLAAKKLLHRVQSRRLVQAKLLLKLWAPKKICLAALQSAKI